MMSDWALLGIPLLIGCLASVSAGLVGSLVVVKRVSTLSGGLAHAILAGIGIGLMVGIDPFIGAFVAAIVLSGIMALIRHNRQQHEDVLISLIWTVGMAVGILCLFLSGGYSEDILHYLFGNILLTSAADLVLISGLTVIVLAVNWLGYGAARAFTFDESYLAVMNLPTGWIRFIFYVLIGITTVVLTKIVGILLVMALLTLPAATAKLFSKTLARMQGLSVVLALVATLLGSILSYVVDVPTGPLIILVSAALYIVGLFSQRHLA